MTTSILLIPSREKVGLISVAMGVIRNLEQHGVKCAFFSPINLNNSNEREYRLINENATQTPYIPFEQVTEAMEHNNLNGLLQDLVSMHNQLKKNQDVVVIKGIAPNIQHPYINKLNAAMAQALDADIIFVTTPGEDYTDINSNLEIAVNDLFKRKQTTFYGCIINKVGCPIGAKGIAPLEHSIQNNNDIIDKMNQLPIFTSKKVTLLGTIEWNEKLYSPRVIDIIDKLNATVVCKGNLKDRRIAYLKLCARSVNTVLHVLTAKTLIITAGDRADIIIASALAELKGIKISAIILTGCYDIRDSVIEFCQPAIDAGLSVLSVPTNSYDTANLLHSLDTAIPLDDKERIELVKDTIAHRLNPAPIIENLNQEKQQYITPPAFMYGLLKKAKSNKKRILLPEGQDERILLAAYDCAQKNIAELILFAQPEAIKQFCSSHHLEFNDHITVIDPNEVRDQYISLLCEVRKHKNMTPDIAKKWLADDIVLATLMLQNGDVDGLVAGATISTANTIRPALQIIKTQPKITKVSSLFFMCLPESVLVFADCAISPNPNAEELAHIAQIAATTAQQFGIPPRIAMLSYSTGTSGLGCDVDKVRQATETIQSLQPDWAIDGPLQYDAAINPSVAKIKAPNSPVAGQATVFIFPDLNTGNTTYKAVQRSANIVCMGPVLLGLNKPVNDLSRGCSVKDIIYTIAITAVQAQA